MEELCTCCERPSEHLKEYPLLNVSVCEGCYHTIDRLGGVQLRKVEHDVTPEIKQRFITATKKMRKPKPKKG